MIPLTGGTSLVAGAFAVIKTGATAIKIGTIVKQVKLLSGMIKLTKVVGAVAVAGAVAGTVIASQYNLNNLQYVDVLTQEQYFRQCGTLPPTEQR